jgi:repressor LexA
MEDEGIENDDLVVIRQEAAAPKKGDLVIALNEEGQSTLKKYGGRDRKTGKAILEYCNKAVYGNKRILVKDLVCQGIVSHVIKQK